MPSKTARSDRVIMGSNEEDVENAGIKKGFVGENPAATVMGISPGRMSALAVGRSSVPAGPADTFLRIRCCQPGGFA
jgi:hypothetical protein